MQWANFGMRVAGAWPSGPGGPGWAGSVQQAGVGWDNEAGLGIISGGGGPGPGEHGVRRVNEAFKFLMQGKPRKVPQQYISVSLGRVEEPKGFGTRLS